MNRTGEDSAVALLILSFERVAQGFNIGTILNTIYIIYNYIIIINV